MRATPRLILQARYMSWHISNIVDPFFLTPGCASDHVASIPRIVIDDNDIERVTHANLKY